MKLHIITFVDPVNILINNVFVYAGAAKLKDETVNLKLFLDDGFEIDEDEILLSQVTENRILVLALSSEFAAAPPLAIGI